MKRIWQWLGAIGLAIVVVGCGGGGTVASPDATPDIPAMSLDTIDAAGGRVVGAGGVTVVVPEGALAAPATLRIAADSAGAPPLPESMRLAGEVWAVTPGGLPFAKAVELRIPRPRAAVPEAEELALVQADADGQWQAVGALDAATGELVAEVDRLGHFAVVAMQRPRKAAQATSVPIKYSITVSCASGTCNDLPSVPTVVTWRVTSNGGVIPATCVNPELLISKPENGFQYLTLPLSGGTLTRTLSRPGTGLLISQGSRIYLRCANSTTLSLLGNAAVTWRTPVYPALKVDLSAPAQQAAPGENLTISALFIGASGATVQGYRAPTPDNRAVVTWERTDDAGLSWRAFATSYQDESPDPQPVSTLPKWFTWKVSTRLAVTAADANALFRARACYTPPDVAAPPCVATKPARLTLINVPTLPSIKTPPRPLRIVAGQTASFSVGVSGLPTPTLQWQQRPANSTSTWTNIAGATAASYTTGVLGLPNNGQQFRVVATNAVGSTPSLPVTVSVNATAVAPTIVNEPLAITVLSGSDAVFAVRAAGTDALSFQWRHNGVDLTGANAAVLRLAAVTDAQAGDYRVVVTNAVGSVTSAAGRLTVSDVPVTVVPPTIVAGPAPASVAQGQSVTFTVGVTGTGPFTYQWRKGAVDIPGATAASHTIASAQTGDAGSYAVVVSGSGTSVTSAAATLAVTPATAPVAPTITAQPVSVVVVPGATTTLAVAASGTGPLSYQWFQDGAPVAGANGPTLTLNSIDAISNGSYTVTVSNTLGSVTSAPAQLLVAGTPQVGVMPDVADGVEGTSVSFSISADGSGLRYQWTRNRIAIPGATEALYTTPVLTLADSGAVYGVIVYNGAGLVIVEGIVLTVTPPPNPPGLVLFGGSFNETNNATSGDGTGTDARFNEPRSLVADASGNLYVANRNGGFVSKVTPGAVVTRIAEHGFSGALALGADGSLLSMQYAVGTQANLRLLAPLQAGAATQARNCGSPICGGTISPNRPFAAIAADGTVYTAWQDANFISVTSGPLSEVNPPIAFFAGTSDLLNRPAGWVDGTGTAARFDGPSGIALGPDGKLYVADTNNHVIRRITPAGVVSTFAGTGTVAGSSDGALLSASFNRPLNIGFDAEGALWVQEIGPAGAPRTSLRKIAGGQVSTPVADLQAEIDTLAGGPSSSAVVNGFTRSYGGMAVIGPKRLAFTVTHALLVLTLP